MSIVACQMKRCSLNIEAKQSGQLMEQWSEQERAMLFVINFAITTQMFIM